MSTPVRLGPQPQDKSYRGLFAAIHGDEQYVSGTAIPEALGSFRYIIENYGSGNNTVGSDESLFKQFHAWVSGTILYNTETDDASNNWTLPGMPSSARFHQNFFSMSIENYGDRYHSHLNHGANFRWMEGNEYTIFTSLGFSFLNVPFSGSYAPAPGGFGAQAGAPATTFGAPAPAVAATIPCELARQPPPMPRFRVNWRAGPATDAPIPQEVVEQACALEGVKVVMPLAF